MADTKIEWTDVTWNPVAGCSIVSAGCTNCYAMRMAARLEAMGVVKYAGLTRKTGGRAKWTGRVFLDWAALDVPKRWKTPKKVFVNSMSDLFHDDVPLEFIRRVWSTMESTPHVFQILTKRPERMSQVMLAGGLPRLTNVWLGTSVENAEVLHRLDWLRNTPAAVRFVSFEPLIGSVSQADLSGIDWVIVGGESGPNARPLDTLWVDELHDLCDASGAAFLFKQWGGKNKKARGRIYHERTCADIPGLRM